MKRKVKRAKQPDQTPLKEAFDEFISEREAKNLSSATIRSYKQSYRFFSDYAKTVINEDNEEEELELICEFIEPHLIYRWLNHLKNEGVKPTSINHYLRDVRTFLNWCMDSAKEYIVPFKIELVKGQEETIKVYTPEEQEALIEKPGRTAMFGEWRTWAIVNWVLATGNRASTILNVKMMDLNFAKREITLAHTKNKKAQVIPMSSALESVLKEYIRLFRSEASGNAFLFPNVGEEQLTYNALRMSYKKYTEQRGVSKSNIHGLRHTFAREYIVRGGNVFSLQKILGHKTIAMTQRYVTVFSDDIKAEYDNFSPLDNLKKGTSRKKLVSKSK